MTRIKVDGADDVFVVTHPAKFSDGILGQVTRLLAEGGLTDGGRVLDPFAGTGKIHMLDFIYDTVGVEIEQEWADMHERTVCGNSLELVDMFGPNSFDGAATSPTYGNRMADHHDAQDGSRRLNYRAALGHELHVDNTGRMQWGMKYRNLHRMVYMQLRQVLKPGAPFVLNVSDHIRDKERVEVSDWHFRTLEGVGFQKQKVVPVQTPRMGFGANRDARVPVEFVVLFVNGKAA